VVEIIKAELGTELDEGKDDEDKFPMDGQVGTNCWKRKGKYCCKSLFITGEKHYCKQAYIMKCDISVFSDGCHYLRLQRGDRFWWACV